MVQRLWGYTPRMRVSETDPRPMLAATISPLVSARECDGTREALEWASACGFRGVQLSATDPETRPRELSQSARRDLLATLQRLELVCSGIDLFLPVTHLSDPAHISRAFDAIAAAIELCALLGRVPLTLPIASPDETPLRAEIAAAASHAGVAILVGSPAGVSPPFAISVDCAAVLAAADDPSMLVARLGRALGGVRVVDLLRSGLRGPIGEPRESRLDILGLQASLDAAAFTGLPVADARQWGSPRAGLEATLARWSGSVRL